ncbi:MAG: hypothetical protein GX624_00400 [Actinobacteria bacterium]|nr:hypothetical protein [Actinomycetota bacterium]
MGGVQVTVDGILDSCENSCADDWVYWVYICDGVESGRPGGEPPGPVQPVCARAVYRPQREIGLAWSPAGESELASLPAWPAPALEGECVYHWVELLFDGAVVDRHLACWFDAACASLPVPRAEPQGDGRDPLLLVSRRAYRLVRLANEVDPECTDFDACFARSGIELLQG